MGKGLGGRGIKVSKLGKSVGLKRLFLTPSTASAPLHSLQLLHCCWYGLHRAGGGERGAVFKYINNACSMQMNLPLNITLVMLSGCASRDPGVTVCVGTAEGGGGVRGTRNPLIPWHSPASPPPPQLPHIIRTPAPSHIPVLDKFLGSQHAMQPGSPVP